jgi:hypothetical protein
MRDMGPPPVSGGAQGQKQIPFGDDNQMNNGKNKEQRQKQRTTAKTKNNGKNKGGYRVCPLRDGR